ncbi:hypothetical protein [Saccharopolyspora sp. NPDC002376]
MSNFVGLTNANAMGQGGQNLGTEAQGLRAQLQNLINDMAKDKDAIQGSALAAFQQARYELETRFDELVRWCHDNGVDLGEAQTQVGTNDQTTHDDFRSAGSQLAGIPAKMNR